ncbi:hypothetical protein SAMN06264365_104526 [Actinoplanes regularis]|uniref:Uncharacterized protein n=1 Tax=Actinoplanes regularis TaxID=52697 RepID=A0A238YG15_9ACTN|nr:hypothetical protein SAMN06264365_104526 [Actinoplanes regularis]
MTLGHWHGYLWTGSSKDRGIVKCGQRSGIANHRVWRMGWDGGVS